jgi:hydroxypyruvate isomerase
MPRLAANLGFLFQEVGFFERFEAAARAGFHGVEHGFPYEAPPEAIAERLQTHGLQQVLCNFPPGDRARGERGVAALPGREEKFVECAERALEYAQALSCPYLHATAGTPPAGVARQDCEAVFIRNLRWAADMLKPHGVRVLIEPLNTRDNPGTFLSTTAQARQIIERVGSDNLFLQMDLYNCQVMRGDLAEEIKTHLPIIGHIQIAGNPGRHEPDVGEVNYPYLFDLLDDLGYPGWVSCEYRPRGETAAGLGWGRAYGLGVTP